MDFVKRFNLTPHVEGGAFRELYREIDNARLTKYKLGLEDGAEPCVLMKAGTIFGAKHLSPADEATLVSCVTVPEFTYDHYRICEREEVVNLCPAAGEFYTK